MRVVGFVPAKLNSQRLPRKSVLPLAGRPLVNYALETLERSRCDETVVFASTPEILEFVEPERSPRYVERPRTLDTDETTVQEFVGGFLDLVPCDVVVLLHITSPFIRSATIDACIDAVVSGRHESAFVALEFRRFAWFGGQPLNYDLATPVPRTQDLEPVLVEQSGAYVFTRQLFERTGRRIADEPHIEIVDWVEGHDIDTREELELAELLVALRSADSPS